MVGLIGFEPMTNGFPQSRPLQNFVIPNGSSNLMLSGARRTTWLYYNPTLFLERYKRNYKKAPTHTRKENRMSHFRSVPHALRFAQTTNPMVGMTMGFLQVHTHVLD